MDAFRGNVLLICQTILHIIYIHSPVVQTVVLSARFIVSTSSLDSGTSPCGESTLDRCQSFLLYVALNRLVLEG